MTRNEPPPAWIEALLTVCLPAGEVREGIVGDLHEDFRALAAAWGRAVATVWYSVLAIRIGVRYAVRRSWRALARQRPPGENPGLDTRTSGGMTMEGVWRDVRHAGRGLRKAPGFAVVSILTLGLGIGATTAIFSVVNGVLLKPLPFEDQDELVGVWHGPGIERPLNVALYSMYRDESRVFEDIGSYVPSRVSVTGLAEPEQLSAARVTAGLLPLLRVQPVIGRRFTEEDDSPGAPLTIMLSHAYWQGQFGADPGVVGITLRVNGTQREIVGVLPPAFALP